MSIFTARNTIKSISIHEIKGAVYVLRDDSRQILSLLEGHPIMELELELEL